jgi:hypothetical protein
MKLGAWANNVVYWLPSLARCLGTSLANPLPSSSSLTPSPSLQEAYDLIFVSTTTLLVADSVADLVTEFRYDGTYVGVFANVTGARGIALIPAEPFEGLDSGSAQVAVCQGGTWADDSGEFPNDVLFFDLAEGLGGANLQAWESTGKITFKLLDGGTWNLSGDHWGDGWYVRVRSNPNPHPPKPLTRASGAYGRRRTSSDTTPTRS